MPFMLLIFGLMMIVAAYNNTQATLAAQLSNDLRGARGFFAWFAGITIIGAIGYYAPARTASRAFMALLLIAMFLANKSIFEQFTTALGGGTGTDNNKDNSLTFGRGITIDGEAIGSSNESKPLEITVTPSGTTTESGSDSHG